MMSKEEKQELKVRLEQELATIEQELHDFTREVSQAPGGHEAYVENSEEISQEDEAQVSEEYARRKALEAVLEARLEEVREALTRIDSKTYGVCSRCHTPIPMERLRINPAATTCIQCAQ